MAKELGAHNIRVNCICSGPFKSEITKDLMEKDWIKKVARASGPFRNIWNFTSTINDNRSIFDARLF
uniref:Uncharacterized protein n=1 Tax=Cucumis melo TaxID=3656 RepID=A0A9I9D8T8_CUCME